MVQNISLWVAGEDIRKGDTVTLHLEDGKVYRHRPGQVRVGTAYTDARAKGTIAIPMTVEEARALVEHERGERFQDKSGWEGGTYDGS